MFEWTTSQQSFGELFPKRLVYSLDINSVLFVIKIDIFLAIIPNLSNIVIWLEFFYKIEPLLYFFIVYIYTKINLTDIVMQTCLTV